ncbi:MAG: hypothetical protein Q8N48_12050 [Thiobacillus sp.]|nr:hypothetical protein [Thiobacillus sp.]MDP2979546.1 hypothetical protein [Thiobacillus sp.]
MIEIDASFGEGGGQILRGAPALSPESWFVRGVTYCPACSLD